MYQVLTQVFPKRIINTINQYDGEESVWKNLVKYIKYSYSEFNFLKGYKVKRVENLTLVLTKMDY